MKKKEKLRILKERMGHLEDQIGIQCVNGNWNYDPYMRGLANGLILAHATMNGIEPTFLEHPGSYIIEEENHKTDHGADVPEVQPFDNDTNPAIWDLVIEDMHKRDQMGAKKYGKRLKPFNGRDALWDAYQEALDFVAYIRQEIYEKENNNV